MNAWLIILLTLGIVLIKIAWIRTELKFSKSRFNFQMVKTNGVEALILILQIIAAVLTPIPHSPFTFPSQVLGVLMYLLGYILAFWGKNTMSKSWGVPGEHSHKQKKLVTTGPFTFSRNPIYVAFLLIYFGYAIAIQSWLIILRIPLVYYFYKAAVMEEENLEKIFGHEYTLYKRRVPRFV